MMLSPFLTLPCDCSQARRRMQAQLARAGLRSLQTFDLHTARRTPQDCPCPHHGTTECDCQMVVLLVYGEAEEPVTLILHGHQNITWVSFAEGAGQRGDVQLMSAVQAALTASLRAFPR